MQSPHALAPRRHLGEILAYMLAFVVLIPACLTFISISGVSSGPEGDQLCVQATARNLRTQGESHLLMLVLCYMYPHVETFGCTIHQAVTCLYYRLSRSITENRNVVLVPAHSVAACSMLRPNSLRAASFLLCRQAAELETSR